MTSSSDDAQCDAMGELERLLESDSDDLRALRADELDVVLPPLDDGTPEPYSRASAERIYRLIIEQMNEGAVITPFGIDTIVYCNRSFASMVDLPPERVVGERLSQWLEPVEGPSVEDLLERSGPQRGDFRLRSGSGGDLPVAISATLVLEGDRSSRCLIVSDLRVRRDVERLRQVRAELELSHQRKNEFLAMLGHELRNPLAPVRQALELMQAHASPDDPRYLVRARDVIARQVVHLKRLVDDLLDVGRVTKGTLVVQRSTVDLREAVAVAKESVDRLIARRHHEVRVSLPDEPMLVDGDAVRLTQVFTNIISNAAKYTPDGGHIEITATREGDRYQVRVADDGRGIEPDLIPYLFEPFVQSEATIDRSAGGIGVGLTLVRRILDLHDGTVEALSEGEGRGTELRVTLPVAEAPSPHRAPAPERASSEAMATPAARRILVVDDNEDAAEMLALVLRKRGFAVSLAHDGEEALEAVQEHDPEIVLLDIGLPGIDGYEVARRLRAEQRPSPRILVALTGYGQPEDRQQALDAGFDLHLVKPVAVADLLEALHAQATGSSEPEPELEPEPEPE